MNAILKIVTGLLILWFCVYIQGCTIKINCKEIDSIHFHNGEEQTEETAI